MEADGSGGTDGGCSSSGVGEPDCKLSHGQNEILCPPLSSEVGNDCIGLHQRNGLHQQSPSGCKEGCSPKHKGRFPKAKGGDSGQGQELEPMA